MSVVYQRFQRFNDVQTIVFVLLEVLVLAPEELYEFGLVGFAITCLVMESLLAALGSEGTPLNLSQGLPSPSRCSSPGHFVDIRSYA